MTKNVPNKKDKKKKPSQKIDALLECLVFLTAHYGRAKSARALTSGLAYNGHSMHPDLFTEAAQRLGLRTQIVKKAKITDISEAVLPAVLILQGKRACVLLSGSTAPEIYDPATGQKKQVKLRELQQDYAGYCILTQALPEFTNPYAAASEEDHRHWFWSLVNQNKGIFAMVLLGAVFINLFGLASPLFIMNVYDRVIPNNAIETGWALGIGALVVFVFDLIMRSLRAYLLDLAGRRVDVIATRRIYDQVLNMRLCERPKSSGAFANMLRDFDSVRDFFTSATITALVDLPFTLFFLFIIYKLGGPIAFILLGLLGAVLVIGLILQVPLKALVRKAARSAESKHGMLVETIHGLETIKAIGADGAFRARYGALVGENAAYGQSSRMVSGLGINAATFIQQIASVVIVLSGMYLVADGALTVGGLIACVILSGRALAPVGQIANLLTRYHQASGALATLDSIMNKPVERPASRNFLHRPDIKGKITFDQVGFEYPGVKRAVLDKVSFTINPGERVAIIGRIGSGKSTTARLMMGLYEPTAGHILADDTDYQQIDPADLRRSLAYIAQDVVLFTGSVRDNIAASCPSASEEDILAAAKAAGVHEFVSRHPMGYDAPVGEHGEGLSGGQRQAIALARAMLIKPKVLICDEPTNAMDMQAEIAFKSYVENEIEGKTFILITHKHTMLEMVDRLILLDQGRLIMDGPREEVVAALQSGKVQVQG
ncbi:MAG: type I secretion system permease/ATPase [Alphaproteobacteria bacterium]|nr:type I secretion system permease/ATPase [Alphaproteobacteria bacterium]